MKYGAKKSRTKAPAKKRRRKKPSTVDRFHAVLIAAVLIMAAGITSFAVMYLHSAKSRNEAARVEHAGTAAPAVQETVPATVTQAPSQVIVAPPLAETKAEQRPESPPAEKVQPVQSVPAAQKPAPGVPVSQAPVVESKTLPVAGNKTIPAVSPVAGGISERPSVSRGTLAFVIDDAGNNLHELDPFLKLDMPLTIAVLPGLAYSAEAARRIRAAGKEVFLHQPMEALGGQNPGPGAIRFGMGRDEIRSIVMRNLDEIGPVAGINNHEGSRVTMDEEAMVTIIALCRERGILFLDSRTTADTAAPRAAQQLGITIGERDVFVDNVQERESMIGYINTGLSRAEQKGSAILIGHVWSKELAPLLANLFPGLRERGYSFSPVSKVINRTGI